MRLFIGIAGKLGAGKKFIAQHVVSPVLGDLSINYLRCAFGDQPRINAMSKYNISYMDMCCVPTITARKLLDIEGMDYGRALDDNIWIKYVDNWSKLYYNRGIEAFVIHDVYYKSEASFIRESGGFLVHVDALHRSDQYPTRASDLEGNESYDLCLVNDIENGACVRDMRREFLAMLNGAPPPPRLYSSAQI